MKKVNTRRALLMSCLSLLLCMSMLVGTTFAWFTDSVTSGNNIIKSGTLDIELEYSTDLVTWKTVEGATDIFDKEALWEPGHTEAVYLRLTNKGNLAVKYQFGINFTDTVVGTSVLGNDIYLSEYLKYGIVDATAAFADREAAREAVKDTAVALNTYTVSGQMTVQGESKTVAMVIYMPETVGNEANYRGEQVPQIDLGVTLFATQLVSEEDSFGPEYDASAPWTGSADIAWYQADTAATEFVIDTAEELAGLAALVNGTAEVQDSFQNKTVKLGANIDLNNVAWTPIGNSSSGFYGTFDGDGKTVYNLSVTAQNNAGLFGYALNGGNVKNLTVENAVIKANDYAGAIMGRGYTDIDNCHVKNVTVITTPYKKADGSYDGGAKAGGVIGQLLEGAGNTVTNCSATNVEIYAFRDLGGVVGMVHNNNSASGNTATNVTLGYLLNDQITADENENAGAIYGRVQSSATVSPAQDSAENQAYTLVYAVYDVNSLTSLANYVNNGTNLFLDQTVVMIDDIDLQNKAWTPIGQPGPNGSTDFTRSFRGTFDGKDHTVSNLSVSNTGFAGLFGLAYKAAINNVKVDGATVNSNRMTGTVVGQLYGSIDNCHVADATVTVVPNAVANGYDNGDKVGGIVGWIGDNNNNRTLTNCSATNVSLKAYRDVGGIAGYAAYSTTISNNEVKDIQITVDQVTNHYGDKEPNANAIWGRNSVSGSGVGITASGNTEENVSISTVVG